MTPNGAELIVIIVDFDDFKFAGRIVETRMLEKSWLVVESLVETDITAISNSDAPVRNLADSQNVNSKSLLEYSYTGCTPTARRGVRYPPVGKMELNYK